MDISLSGARVVTQEDAPIRHVDLTLMVATVLLSITGLFMVYSATNQTLATFGNDPGYYLKKQGTFLVIAVVVMALTALIDYRLIKIYAPFFYLGAVVLLILVESPLGTTAKGAQRWFQIAGFQFTPSLFVRVALVVMLAASLAAIKGELVLRDVIRVTVLAAIPTVLVFVQPDIGSSIILASILVALLVVAGTRARYLAVLALTASLAIFGAFQLHIIKDYQIQRLTSFIDPQADVQRAGYNKQQAEIAIGSGGFLGKGYLKGTQTNLDYVPEQHTDFIFTVVGEELGFLVGPCPSSSCSGW
jgi:rod shape determining protein RodA